MSTPFFLRYVPGCLFSSRIGDTPMSVHCYYLFRYLPFWRHIQIWEQIVGLRSWYFVLHSPSSVYVPLCTLFFQYLLVDQWVLVVSLQELNIILPVEYFSDYVTRLTTLYNPSGFFHVLWDCTVSPVKFLYAYNELLEVVGFVKDEPVRILTMLHLESLAAYPFTLYAVRRELQIGSFLPVRLGKSLYVSADPEWWKCLRGVALLRLVVFSLMILFLFILITSVQLVMIEVVGMQKGSGPCRTCVISLKGPWKLFNRYHRSVRRRG